MLHEELFIQSNKDLVKITEAEVYINITRLNNPLSRWHRDMISSLSKLHPPKNRMVKTKKVSYI
jgi:hypothetical protein